MAVTAILAGAATMVIETGCVEFEWVTADGEWQRSALDAAAGAPFEEGCRCGGTDRVRGSGI